MTAPSYSCRLLCALAFLLAVAAGLRPSPAQAQQSDREKASRQALLEGTDVFRRILFDLKMAPLANFDDALLDEHPEKCIVVVLGNLDKLAETPGGLAGFLRAGGAVLAASDRELKDRIANEQLQTAAGVTISGNTFVCAKEFRCYKEKPFCPFLDPVPRAKPALLGREENDLEGHPTWLQVATNVPSSLQLVKRRLPDSIHQLARLPLGSVAEQPGQTSFARPLFAVGGDVGRGRLLVLADHSLFINEMMLPSDNQNVEFTSNCMTWLRGVEGQRDHVLFVEDGKIKTDFSIPLKSVNLPFEEILKTIYDKRNVLLGEFEQRAARLEDEDFFNGKLLGWLESLGPQQPLALFVAVIGTLVLLLYGVYRLGIRHRFNHDLSAPLLAPAVGRSLPVAPLQDQRTDALLKHGNLWQPGSVLVRQWFLQLGVAAPEGGTPAFVARGSWFQHRKLLARLRRLWRLGHGIGPPQRLTAPQLWSLQRELEELQAAFSSGKWSVAAAEWVATHQAPARPTKG